MFVHLLGRIHTWNCLLTQALRPPHSWVLAQLDAPELLEVLQQQGILEQIGLLEDVKAQPATDAADGPANSACAREALLQRMQQVLGRLYREHEVKL